MRQMRYCAAGRPAPTLLGRSARPQLGLLVGVFLACGGPVSTDGFVGDSAGVRIVTSPDPLERPEGDPLTEWTVSEEPVLTLRGGDSGFGLIAGVARFGDGSIAVADAHERHVRLFDPDGIERATVGRRGEGPGEFESIDGIWAADGGVAIWDARLVRYTLIAPDGAIGATVGLEPTGERARPTPLGFASNGDLFAINDLRSMPDEERYRADLAIVSFRPDGTVAATIATVQGAEMWNWVWEMGVTPSTVPFGRPTVSHFTDDGIYVGDNAGYRIDRYDLAGTLTTSIRLLRDPLPLSSRLVDQYLEAERTKASSGAAAKGGSDIFGMMAEDAPYPEWLPFYDAILTDDAGNLWVRDYVTNPDTVTRYVVFGPGGEAVATAELPPRFRVTEIEGGLVLGVWRNELDIEQVRAYTLH
ncbi:MAG: hypothetical protein ACC682_15185 [Gemmatimonadota bacterium]